MEAMAPASTATVTCPACGGAGGGPFGRAGSAWDDDEYVCPRCEGLGTVMVEQGPKAGVMPGLVKVAPVALPEQKRARGDRGSR
jgi:hypothetical protein